MSDRQMIQMKKIMKNGIMSYAVFTQIFVQMPGAQFQDILYNVGVKLQHQTFVSKEPRCSTRNVQTGTHA